MRSPSSHTDDIRYALVRKHPDGSLSFKTSLSTYLGQWAKELAFAKLNIDSSQLRAALTKEKKKISRMIANHPSKNSYASDSFIQDLHIPYTYYLLPIKLSYDFATATPIP